jgi:hypothetical protein
LGPSCSDVSTPPAHIADIPTPPYTLQSMQRPGRRPGGADGLGGRQRVALALGAAGSSHRQPQAGPCPGPEPRTGTSQSFFLPALFLGIREGDC